MQPPSPDRLVQDAIAAQRSGNAAHAASLFRQLLAIVPEHPVALNALGMIALGQDNPAAAAWFARATEADPSSPPLWMNLATAHRNLSAFEAERAALEQALAIDQRHLMANVRMAEWHERFGEGESAAFRWHGVATIVRSLPSRTPPLDQLLERAEAAVGASRKTLADRVDAALAPTRAMIDGVARRRFEACIDAMLGRRAIYQPAPHGLHFPFLAADEFFERRHFPWLEALERQTPAIVRELEALLNASDSGFAPYVTMTPGTPDNLWSPLNGSDGWSARYFWRYGERDDSLCARCPDTAAAIDAVPKVDLTGRAPTAFFSILKPGVHLPPHTGTSNVRSVLHLPLMVPPGCGFRVGGEVREWMVGEAFVFDDTIEHEAWNRGTALRAVLILDVWNPYLAAEERVMLQTLFDALGAQLNMAGAVAD